jgi:outer membrane receptor for monomeric catechols
MTAIWMSDTRTGLETVGSTGRTYKLAASSGLRAHAAERSQEGALSLFVREPNQRRFCFVGGFRDLGAAGRAVELLEAV